MRCLESCTLERQINRWARIDTGVRKQTRPGKLPTSPDGDLVPFRFLLLRILGHTPMHGYVKDVPPGQAVMLELAIGYAMDVARLRTRWLDRLLDAIADQPTLPGDPPSEKLGTK